MKITIKWLEKYNACNDAVKEYKKRKLKLEGIDLVKLLIKEKRYDWADWLIVRIMKYKQHVGYAIYAAEQVIDIFEKKYPDDKRPREAIEAAKKCLKNPNKKNKAALAADAYVAATAAAYAYVVADADVAASLDAASDAYAAAVAASDAAAYAYVVADAYAAAVAASDAAAVAASDVYVVAAADAYADADAYNVACVKVRNKMKLKILKYGLKLLGE